MNILFKAAIVMASALLYSSYASAQDHSTHNHAMHMKISNDNPHIHHDHSSAKSAPIGIMGDHTHNEGDWMVSYRYMQMNMDGNRDGTDELSPLEISGNFLNTTGVGPSTLRIVPTEMDMEMHMLGAMYAPTHWLTLMVMGNFVEKDMSHITYSMMDPTNKIGEFKTRSSGWGDTKVSGLFKVYETGRR